MDDMREHSVDPVRSRIMARVGARNTGPEMAVRRWLWKRGVRYRLHVASLPGKPDIVVRKLRVAVMVHGCFWHGHDCPRGARVPKTRQDYWMTKIGRNRARDAQNVERLRGLGWTVVEVWECEIRNELALSVKLGLLVPADEAQPSAKVEPPSAQSWGEALP